MEKAKLVATGIFLAIFLMLVPGYLQATEGPVMIRLRPVNDDGNSYDN